MEKIYPRLAKILNGNRNFFSSGDTKSFSFFTCSNIPEELVSKLKPAKEAQVKKSESFYYDESDLDADIDDDSLYNYDSEVMSQNEDADSVGLDELKLNSFCQSGDRDVEELIRAKKELDQLKVSRTLVCKAIFVVFNELRVVSKYLAGRVKKEKIDLEDPKNSLLKEKIAKLDEIIKGIGGVGDIKDLRDYLVGVKDKEKEGKFLARKRGFSLFAPKSKRLFDRAVSNANNAIDELVNPSQAPEVREVLFGRM